MQSLRERVSGAPTVAENSTPVSPRMQPRQDGHADREYAVAREHAEEMRDCRGQLLAEQQRCVDLQNEVADKSECIAALHMRLHQARALRVGLTMAMCACGLSCAGRLTLSLGSLLLPAVS